LLTGRGAFVGDIGFPHQLHMRVVRSPYANAVLRSVNVTMELAAPGIVAVWTAAEIAGLPRIDFRDPAAETLRPRFEANRVTTQSMGLIGGRFDYLPVFDWRWAADLPLVVA
jgi:CO/xanthine dehydrogenase Mo-binding subunit